jgi:hypothetical protein
MQRMQIKIDFDEFMMATSECCYVVVRKVSRECGRWVVKVEKFWEMGMATFLVEKGPRLGFFLACLFYFRGERWEGKKKKTNKRKYGAAGIRSQE